MDEWQELVLASFLFRPIPLRYVAITVPGQQGKKVITVPCDTSGARERVAPKLVWRRRDNPLSPDTVC